MEILLWVLVIMVLSLIVGIGSLWLVWRSLQRRNRVSPSRPSPAPMLWLWSPALAARLHRRLRAAAAVARAVADRQRSRPARFAGEDTRLADMARTLEREAADLDEHLALVGRLPGSQRRRAIPMVLAEVSRIEALASRLSMFHIDLGVDARLAEQASTLQQLTVELDHLEAANDVLAAVEVQAGLQRPNPLRMPPDQRPSPSSR